MRYIGHNDQPTLYMMPPYVLPERACAKMCYASFWRLLFWNSGNNISLLRLSVWAWHSFWQKKNWKRRYYNYTYGTNLVSFDWAETWRRCSLGHPCQSMCLYSRHEKYVFNCWKDWKCWLRLKMFVNFGNITWCQKIVCKMWKCSYSYWGTTKCWIVNLKMCNLP